MVLLRHLLGDALRRLRLRQGRTLREVSASARVSLGYLSEVERGQKEASSELLAAICAALGAPLSQVLREVSDNFALAELQSEPVYADVMVSAIEVAGGHGGESTSDQAQADQVASAALTASAGRRLPVGAGSRLPLAAAQMSASRLSASQRISVPAGSRLPLTTGLQVGQPVFEQVTRTACDITDMVPVSA
jgi:transcriptional regulator with XRE-family HTH domain